jgi:mRNA-degrading endonuclease RelE of RelBE toxin-antitoxin system
MCWQIRFGQIDHRLSPRAQRMVAEHLENMMQMNNPACYHKKARVEYMRKEPMLRLKPDPCQRYKENYRIVFTLKVDDETVVNCMDIEVDSTNKVIDVLAIGYRDVIYQMVGA